MQDIEIIVGVAIFGVLVTVLGGAWAKYYEPRRTKLLAELARRRGWAFRADPEPCEDLQPAWFSSLHREASEIEVFNTMHASVEIDGHACGVRMGDCKYIRPVGSGANSGSRTQRCSYLLLTMPFEARAPLRIRSKRVGDRFMAAFGGGDVGFESPAFNDRFRVESPNRMFAHAVVTPRMMVFLLEGLPTMVEVRNNLCFLSDGRTRWTVSEFDGNVRWIGRFVSLWPEHLVADSGSGR